MDMEEKKARHFEQGQTDDLRLAVVVLELGTCHEILAKAQFVDFRGHASGDNKQQYGQLEKRKWIIKAKKIRTFQRRVKEIRLKMTIRAFHFVASARSAIKELVFWKQMYVFDVQNKDTSPCFALRTNNLEMDSRNMIMSKINKRICSINRATHNSSRNRHPEDKQGSLQ